jgi:hypothetical protein
MSLRDRDYGKENAMRYGHSWILAFSVEDYLQAFEITRSDLLEPKNRIWIGGSLTHLTHITHRIFGVSYASCSWKDDVIGANQLDMIFLRLLPHAEDFHLHVADVSAPDLQRTCVDRDHFGLAASCSVLPGAALFAVCFNADGKGLGR